MVVTIEHRRMVFQPEFLFLSGLLSKCVLRKSQRNEKKGCQLFLLRNEDN